MKKIFIWIFGGTVIEPKRHTIYRPIWMRIYYKYFYKPEHDPFVRKYRKLSVQSGQEERSEEVRATSEV